MKSIFIAAVLALVLAGCGGPSEERIQSLTDQASSTEIIKRATYDLKCPVGDIKARRIAGEIVGNLNFGAPNGSWLAEGCNKHGMYQVMCKCTGRCSDAEEYSCNPMLESVQSMSQMDQNAATNAHVAADAAAAASAANLQQQQQLFQQQQAQQQQMMQQQVQQQQMQVQQAQQFHSSPTGVGFTPVR